MNSPTKVRGLSVRDIRFPSSLVGDGTSAMHPDPDYSCVYVVLFTDKHLKGYGLTSTIGRGTEIVMQAVKSLAPIIVGKSLKQMFGDFNSTWRNLTSESQLRWLGPEKGVIHLATAAIVNALFDLWSRLEQKPLWKLLVDMEPELLVSTIDFRYINDVITKEESISILKNMRMGRKEREDEMVHNGYPAYITSAGWIGYSDQEIQFNLENFMRQGWKHFKIKVGKNLEDDKRRCELVRNIIGPRKNLYLDANQTWDVDEAIHWVKELAFCKPRWIEEPTCPDDIIGHIKITESLEPNNIGVASGGMCQNRIMFKQLLQSKAISICRINASRIGGVPEALAVYLMAKKFNIPVCPHGGGIGLCEMIQHLQIWDYICVSGSKEDRIIEYLDRLEQHFKHPRKMKHCKYLAPKVPGYSVEMWADSLQKYEYPTGSAWNKLFNENLYIDPRKQISTVLENSSTAEDCIPR